jgi:hypothetical protein
VADEDVVRPVDADIVNLVLAVTHSTTLAVMVGPFTIPSTRTLSPFVLRRFDTHLRCSESQAAASSTIRHRMEESGVYSGSWKE